MGNININIPEIRNQAKALKEASDGLTKGTVKVLADANEHLASAWTGESAQIFAKYTEELMELLAQNAAAINRISEFLTESCATIEKADAQVRTKIR